MKNKKIILLPGLFLTLGLFLAGCKFHTYTDKNSGPVVKQTLSEQKFNSMKVSTDIVDTELHVGKTHKVIYRGLIRFKPSVQIKNGILTIKQENKGGRYRISKDNVIAIYLPAKELQKIDMHLEDGDVDFYGNIQAKNIALSAEDETSRLIACMQRIKPRSTQKTEILKLINYLQQMELKSPQKMEISR